MELVVGLTSGRVEGEVNLFQPLVSSQFPQTTFEVTKLVEGHREHFQPRRKVVHGFDVIVVQKDLLNIIVVGIVQKGKFLQRVMRERYLDKSLQVVKVY